MDFILDIRTESKDTKILDKCLEAVAEVLTKDGTYYSAGYSLNNKSFRELSLPLMKFLQENYNPYTRIIIDCDSAEIVEGVKSEVLSKYERL